MGVAKIPRSAAEVSAFKRHNPCPSTQLRRGACPGYQVDHVMPLCAGGADKIENLQWLSVADHRTKTRQDNRVCRYLRKIN
ncbi:MAG: HNH endonuclease signature motif containing protein [Polaromonas sp.]|nr:HNH endonuclease signature motif containing protein [Polaromonas sp.]